jgi:hypothetical protein
MFIYWWFMMIFPLKAPWQRMFNWFQLSCFILDILDLENSFGCFCCLEVGAQKADGAPQRSERQAARSRRGEEVRVKNANFAFVQSYWVANSELFPGADPGQCPDSSGLLRISVHLWVCSVHFLGCSRGYQNCLPTVDGRNLAPVDRW